jgi:hypothetical protein
MRSGDAEPQPWGRGADWCAGIILAELAICGTVGLIAMATAPKNVEFTPASAVPATPAKPETPALEAKIVQDGLRDQIVAVARASGVKVTALPPKSAGAGRSARDYQTLAASVDTVIEVELIQILSSYLGTYSSVPPER